jgi:hypothetical protein
MLVYNSVDVIKEYMDILMFSIRENSEISIDLYIYIYIY